MVNRAIRKYAVSLILFIITILILIWQFIFPDPVPEYLQKLIDNTHPEQTGLKPLLEAFLFIYIWSALITFLAGIVTAIIKYSSGNVE